MQIKYLPTNLYKFYAYSRSQECLGAHRQQIEASVRHWENLRAEGVSEAKCTEFVGISRATFYRRRELRRGRRDLIKAVLEAVEGLEGYSIGPNHSSGGKPL